MREGSGYGSRGPNTCGSGGSGSGSATLIVNAALFINVRYVLIRGYNVIIFVGISIEIKRRMIDIG
jgi:hypothetical protein